MVTCQNGGTPGATPVTSTSATVAPGPCAPANHVRAAGPALTMPTTTQPTASATASASARHRVPIARMVVPFIERLLVRGRAPMVRLRGPGVKGSEN